MSQLSPLQAQGLSPAPPPPPPPPATLETVEAGVPDIELSKPSFKERAGDWLSALHMGLAGSSSSQQAGTSTEGISSNRLWDELQKGSETNSLLLGLGAVVGVMVFILLIYKFK